MLVDLLESKNFLHSIIILYYHYIKLISPTLKVVDETNNIKHDLIFI